MSDEIIRNGVRKMNKYEAVIIIVPTLTAEEIQGAIAGVKEKITVTGGVVTSTDDIGKKKLAYEIKKCNEGYYVLFNFEIEPPQIAELERYFRIKEEIIKFIVVRKDEE